MPCDYFEGLLNSLQKRCETVIAAMKWILNGSLVEIVENYTSVSVLHNVTAGSQSTIHVLVVIVISLKLNTDDLFSIIRPSSQSQQT